MSYKFRNSKDLYLNIYFDLYVYINNFIGLIIALKFKFSCV